MRFEMTRAKVESPSTYQRNDFHAVALGQSVFGVPLTWNQLKIDFNGHGLAGQLQFAYQLGDGCAIGELASLAIDDNLHAIPCLPFPSYLFPWLFRR